MKILVSFTNLQNFRVLNIEAMTMLQYQENNTIQS